VAIAIKSVTSNVVTPTNPVTVTSSESPSTTTIGDLVVVIHANDYYSLSNMATPTATGAPVVNSIVNADGGNLAFPHIKAWWYVANTGGAQVITETETGSHDEEKALIIFVLSGANTTTPVDAGAGSTIDASGTSHLAPTVTTVTANTLLITALQSDGLATGPSAWATPAPLTETLEYNSGSTMRGVVATYQLAATGATGTFTFTSTGSTTAVAVTFAIAAAAGAAGYPFGITTPTPRYR
jgi:hypothetical protein